MTEIDSPNSDKDIKGNLVRLLLILCTLNAGILLPGHTSEDSQPAWSLSFYIEAIFSEHARVTPKALTRQPLIIYYWAALSLSFRLISIRRCL